MLICGPTLIMCSVVCHTEAHNNLRLVHSTKPARYVQPFQYNAGFIGGGAGGGHRPPMTGLGHHALWAPNSDTNGP